MIAPCKNQRDEGFKTCGACRDAIRRYAHANPVARKQRLKRSNDRRRDSGYSAAWLAGRYRALKASGRCPCGNVRDDELYITCAACRERGRQAYRVSPRRFYEAAARRRIENPEANRHYVATRRAHRLGVLGKTTLSEWRAIVKKQRGRCANCNKKAKLDRDHIIPLSRGGCDYAFNIQGLCRSCNARKNASVPIGAQFSLFQITVDQRVSFS